MLSMSGAGCLFLRTRIPRAVCVAGRSAHHWIRNPTSLTKSPAEIGIVSWNILGPMHGEGDKHLYAKRQHVRWAERKERVLAELQRLAMMGQTDVFCLQEMSLASLNHTFIPRMQELGFQCASFSPTTNPAQYSSAPNPQGEGKQALVRSPIGCAIFVNPLRLEVLQARRVVLKSFCADLLDRCRARQFSALVCSKWHSIALAQLRLRASGQTLVVGNTHLFWDPSRPDIKAMQTYAVLSALRAFSRQLTPSSNRPEVCGRVAPHVVLCGDFNCGPYATRLAASGGASRKRADREASAVFKLLSSGVLAPSHPEHPDAVAAAEARRRGGAGVSSPNLGTFGHNDANFKLSNIHCSDDFSPDIQPLFTSKTDDFQGWIDHIWVNDSIQVDEILVPPITRGRQGDSLDASRTGEVFPPIPNEFYPSDHIPIGCSVTLKR